MGDTTIISALPKRPQKNRSDASRLATAELKCLPQGTSPLTYEEAIEPWVQLCSTVEDARALARDLEDLSRQHPVVQKLRGIVRETLIGLIQEELPRVKTFERARQLYHELPEGIPELKEHVLRKWAELAKTYTEAALVSQYAPKGSVSWHIASTKATELKPRATNRKL